MTNTGTATTTTPILILYGSQTGTSKAAAQAIAAQLPTAVPGAVAVGPWTLDDFLTEHSAPWTSLVVIVTSSFGRGDAPRNARQFRLLCDYWVDTYGKATGDGDEEERPLTGLQFALCGLGDSAYRTFQENPRALVAGLTAAGARLVGTVGVCDKASEAPEDDQQAQIDAWRKDLWAPLETAAQTSVLIKEEQLSVISKVTIAAVADMPQF
jgi:sulfite reductase alpha subunit-like flavoprotein